MYPRNHYSINYV